jgi:beta-glucosidase
VTALTFPPGFLWGASTSAYQIEGAAREDGRGASMWDTFAHTPGRVRGGENGDVAADHYHRVAEDIALMRDLGLSAYRFSIAWPRVVPAGSGAVNERGLDFYRRLVDLLLESGIEPVPTLYHWDLPQPLQDAGGWPVRETAYRFAEYAGIVARALGDRVGTWLTLNEPWCTAFLGYGMGRHAPGIRDGQQAVAAVHHLLLAHGLAVAELRRQAPEAQVGVALNVEPYRAASDDAEDVAAALLADGMQNRIFLEPILAGRYPADVLEHLEGVVDLAHIGPGDERTIAAPIDVLGVNYYRPGRVGAERNGRLREWTAWPGDERIVVVPQEAPHTAMGWPVDASGLSELLVRLHREYRLPMLVTENGAAFDDVVRADGAVRDGDRVSYLEQHVRAAHDALEQGADLRGYFVWSLLDNFEWAEGYAKRFGLVYVDYETQRRIPKDSARWYRDVIAANGLNGR